MKNLLCILFISMSIFSQAQIPIQLQPGYANISDLKVIYENGSPFDPPQLEATITSTWEFYEINYRENYDLSADTVFYNIYIKNCYYGIWEGIYDYERYTMPSNDIMILNVYSDTSTINDWYCPNQNFYGLLATDTILASEAVTAGLSETYESQISLYPNPATSRLNIKVNNSALIESVEIKSTDGTTVLEQKETEKIPVSHLAAGVYFVNVRYDNRVITKKFVKE